MCPRPGKEEVAVQNAPMISAPPRGGGVAWRQRDAETVPVATPRSPVVGGTGGKSPGTVNTVPGGSKKGGTSGSPPPNSELEQDKRQATNEELFQRIVRDPCCMPCRTKADVAKAKRCLRQLRPLLARYKRSAAYRTCLRLEADYRKKLFAALDTSSEINRIENVLKDMEAKYGFDPKKPPAATIMRYASDELKDKLASHVWDSLQNLLPGRVGWVVRTGRDAGSLIDAVESLVDLAAADLYVFLSRKRNQLERLHRFQGYRSDRARRAFEKRCADYRTVTMCVHLMKRCKEDGPKDMMSGDPFPSGSGR